MAALIFASGAVWFFVDRAGFKTGAHYTAAVLLFVCIICVVILNGLGHSANRFKNPYLLIAAAMIGAALVIGGVALTTDWNYAVLWIEGTLIALFASFWCVQTAELWNEGLRPDAGGAGNTGQSQPVSEAK
ncbi:MAG: hypothetical protein WKF54_12185 [Nocardioidaceae bacterium]